MYYNKSDTKAKDWETTLDELVTELPFSDKENGSDIIKIKDQSFLVSYKKEGFLDGYILQINSIDSSLKDIKDTQNYFIIALIIIVLLSCIIVNKVIAIVLKRLYIVVNAMHEIEKGNWEVEVTHNQGDEISHLEFYFNKMVKKINFLLEQNTKRAIMEKDAQIRALQNQINSHFLYNTLENIKMIAEISNQYLISESVTALAKMLRYSMNWENSNSTISNEIQYVKNYLKIINMRYDYEITLSEELIENLSELEIPKMTIQPIVENAIIHSIFKMQRDATIRIKMSTDKNNVYISITDDGVGLTEEEVNNLNNRIKGNIPKLNGGNATGIGLRNVQERLRLLFGEESGINVFSSEGKYTKVVVVIQL